MFPQPTAVDEVDASAAKKAKAAIKKSSVSAGSVTSNASTVSNGAKARPVIKRQKELSKQVSF